MPSGGPDEYATRDTTPVLRDLVAGSGLVFQDRGMQSLKGIPGEWRLFAVEH